MISQADVFVLHREWEIDNDLKWYLRYATDEQMKKIMIFFMKTRKIYEMVDLDSFRKTFISYTEEKCSRKKFTDCIQLILNLEYESKQALDSKNLSRLSEIKLGPLEGMKDEQVRRK